MSNNHELNRAQRRAMIFGWTPVSSKNDIASVVNGTKHRKPYQIKLTNNPCSNEAVVALKAHIKKLENLKAVLNQKFKRCHTKEFLDEMSKLRHETLSLDALKEIDKIKDPHELSKALNAYKKRQNFVKKKLGQMEEEFAYWTCETIEKNNDEIAAIDLKIQQCELAIMFVPKWP